jgi:hypothetical protein
MPYCVPHLSWTHDFRSAPLLAELGNVAAPARRHTPLPSAGMPRVSARFLRPGSAGKPSRN